MKGSAVTTYLTYCINTELDCHCTTTVHTAIVNDVFKILAGFENLDPLTFFELSTAPTRGRSLKLVKPGCQLDVRKFSFAHRVVEMWNSLNDRTVACDSTDSFKNKLDKFVYSLGII